MKITLSATGFDKAQAKTLILFSDSDKKLSASLSDSS